MQGGATSPMGMFMLMTGFCCDLIDFFIPFVGPIISVIIISILLYIFKDQIVPKKEREDGKEKTREETEESKKMNEGLDTNLEKKTIDRTASQRQQDLSERRKADMAQKRDVPKSQTTKNTKSSMASDIAKGNIKGIATRLIINFLIDLIPIIGPILGSYTVMVWKVL